jgi:hypothetical protein
VEIPVAVEEVAVGVEAVGDANSDKESAKFALLSGD